MALELIGVPFDSYARLGAVDSAAQVLRSQGLLDQLGLARPVRDAGDLSLPPPVNERARGSGLLNQTAVIALVERLPEPLNGAWDAGRLPLLLGGDCAVLLGAVPAARARFGDVGLLFADGHEDAYPLRDSPDGQAADSEIALLLGRAGDNMPAALASRLPGLDANAVALLGPRAATDGRPTLRGQVFLRHDTELHGTRLADATSAALQIVSAGQRPFWLHVDLDVLSAAEFPAHDFPEPGGVSWEELSYITTRALSTPGCIGWSVVIYNPQLDPDRSTARCLIAYLTTAASGLA